MRRIVSLLLILVVVLGCVGLAACGGGDGGAVPDNGGNEPADGNGNGDGNGDGESLTDILGLGAGITSVRYDTVITSPGSPSMTIRVWLKEDKARSETDMGEGMGTVISIMDMDAQVMYQYFPDQNMAYKMTYAQQTSTTITETQSISGYDPTVIGTQTVDGKVCLVVEYSHNGATVKVWIWKEHGFPVRMETTAAEGTAIIEYKNIDFGNISDSMFELPPGVQIMEY